MKVRMVAALFTFAACSHASLVVADNIFIKRYNYYTAAFYNTFHLTNDNPQGVAANATNATDIRLDGARILQFNDPTGDLNNYIVLTHDSHLNQPYGLAFGPNGLLYVANSGDGSVLRFDANGAYVDTFLTGLVAPQFLTFTETADITPEPGTWALVGATLMFCAGKRMRRGLGTADSHGRRW